MASEHRHDAPPSLDVIHERVRTSLAVAEQRYTDGRRRLVSLLARAGRPVTLPELAALDPAMPQSSMYRNLDVLERTGLVRRIAAGADHAHYELSEPLLGHHHHLICVGCGTVEDVRLDDDFEEVIDANLAAVAAEAGFRPIHHRLDLHGHCPDCVD